MSKTVAISGAASGIGRDLVRHFVEAGSHVVLIDVDGESCAKIAATINEQGGKADALAVDVTNQPQIDEIPKRVPPVDVLINNAGLQHVAKLEEFPADHWRLLIDVMLTGPAMLSRAVIPKMKENNFGRIINIGSIHSLVASPYKSAYVAAKHGILGFSKVLALEVADYDITVNTICPSYVRTPLVDKQIAQQAHEHGISEDEVINKIMLQPMPKKAFIGTDEIASTCDYLISSAAKNISGQSIVLDGGWTVR